MTATPLKTGTLTELVAETEDGVVRHTILAALVSSALVAAPLGAQPAERLIYRASHSVHDADAGLREPSGLALDQQTTEFWTISDDSDHVFRIDEEGVVTARLPRVRGLKDAEAIAVARSGGLVVLSEDNASILLIRPETDDGPEERKLLEMKGAELLLDALDGNPDRLSPEGLAIDPSRGVALIANERDPRLLIELSSALDEIVAVTELTERMGFVADGVDDRRLDISGLATDPLRSGIWLTSDTGKCVFLWKQNDAPPQRFDLLWLVDGKIRKVDNAEGVALSENFARLFIVTDDRKRSRLHEFTIE